MFKKVFIHFRRTIKIVSVVSLGALLIFGAVSFIYKPIYSVSLNGEFIGYCANKSELQNDINDYMKHGEEEQVAFVQIDNLPKYEMCLLKKNIVTNDEEILQTVKETGVPYYEYYAIVQDGQDKLYTASQEEAEKAISQLKEKNSKKDVYKRQTLHSAKGLEFPVVFLVGMEEGIFPGYKSIGEPKELEEERRLCYVGITRAKQDLYLTCAKQRTMFGSTTCNSVSRFLKEIPQELIDGYEAIETKNKSSQYQDSAYQWEYGNKQNKVTSYKDTAKVASIGNKTDFAFRTQDSFLKSLNKKQDTIDLSQYQAGKRVFHKKFGEGVINQVEQEGNDLKVDITFDKVGHKRLMAKYAGLEIIE